MGAFSDLQRGNGCAAVLESAPRDCYGCRSTLASGEPGVPAGWDGRGARPSIVLSVRSRY